MRRSIVISLLAVSSLSGFEQLRPHPAVYQGGQVRLERTATRRIVVRRRSKRKSAAIVAGSAAGGAAIGALAGGGKGAAIGALAGGGGGLAYDRATHKKTVVVH